MKEKCFWHLLKQQERLYSRLLKMSVLFQELTSLSHLGIYGLSTVSTMWMVPKSPSSASKSPSGFPADTLNSMCSQSLACVLPSSLPLPLISSQLLSNLQLGLCNSFLMSFSLFPSLALPLLSVTAIHTPALTAPPRPPYPLPCPPSKRKLFTFWILYHFICKSPVTSVGMFLSQ